jgi:Fe-S-cluster containining protein
MKSAIEGPNCINPQICKGDCCSIKIDVPKVLANEYIRRGYAEINDFVRSNIFSFQLRFNEKTGKCFLFDKEINGCSIHNSGIKPPQCWIYPTGFSNPENKQIKCKKVAGWKIIDYQRAKKAEELLQKYIFLCKIEAKKESTLIKKRLGALNNENAQEKLRVLKEALNSFAPHRLGGFKDQWDNLGLLSAEGLSLQMKKFCNKHNSKCHFLVDDFFKCDEICDEIASKLVEFLQSNLYTYVKMEGPDVEGHYPLYKLLNYKNFNS